jgi:hypothetical protein
MSKQEIYVSTDVEADGPIPGPHSLLSFASAAYTAEKKLVSTFSRNLLQLPRATMHPVQKKFWDENPVAWNACRVDPQPVKKSMKEYLEWLKSLPGKPVFTGFPAAYDYMFVQWYLHNFAGDSPFGPAALDIKTFIMGLTLLPYKSISLSKVPRICFDDLPHTHIALDDAIEQGALFCNALALARKLKVADKLLELSKIPGADKALVGLAGGFLTK